MVEQATDKVAHEIYAECPACPKVAEYPCHIGYASKHHAAIIHRIVPIYGLTIDLKGDVAHNG